MSKHLLGPTLIICVFFFWFPCLFVFDFLLICLVFSFLFFACCTSLPCWISHCTIVVCCCFALMLPLSPCWCSSPYLVVVIACSYSLLPWCYSSSRFYYFSSLCCYCCCLAIHPSTNIAFACHFVNVCSTKPSSLFGESFWLAFFKPIFVNKDNIWHFICTCKFSSTYFFNVMHHHK